jgi:hypothetical protein
VSAVTKKLASVVSEIEGFQKVFSTQSAKDPLKRVADCDLDSSAGTVQKLQCQNSSEGPATERVTREPEDKSVVYVL